MLMIINPVSSDIIQIRPLDFGEIAIVDNSSAHTLSIDWLGNINVDTGIRIIRLGQPGEFEASGFAGNVELFVTPLVISDVMNPGRVSGEYPNLVSLDTAASVRTESDGTAIIFVGGTIQTSNSGSLDFVNDTYSSDIRITINF